MQQGCERRSSVVAFGDAVEACRGPSPTAVLPLTAGGMPLVLDESLAVGAALPAEVSSLTGQHKCQIHIMENVTLTQMEQARLQVLNSLLAEHMTLDQAATLMGVTTRHTRRILAAYREKCSASTIFAGALPHPNRYSTKVVASIKMLPRTRDVKGGVRVDGTHQAHQPEPLFDVGCGGHVFLTLM